MEIVTSWQLQGRAEGRAEGEAEGRAREALQFVRRLLSRRLGPIASSSNDRLGTLSLDDLEQLGEDLLDFRTATDLDHWLATRT